MSTTIAALRARIAELEAIINETFTDENGDVWRTPSPEAYARSCIAARRQGIEEAIAMCQKIQSEYSQLDSLKDYPGAVQDSEFAVGDCIDWIRELLDAPDSDAVLAPPTERTIHLTPEEFAVLLACADFAGGAGLVMDAGEASAARITAEMCERFDLREDVLDNPAAIVRALKARQA